jgi:hypothetical protein
MKKVNNIKSILQGLLLTLLSTLLTFAALEIGIRAYLPYPTWSEFYPVGLGHNLYMTSVPNQFSPVTGFELVAPWDHPSHGNFGLGPFIIYKEGIRANILHPTSPKLPLWDTETSILAVGDSFTLGTEVSNTETWPAHLERLSGRRVLNAGVGGFGIDQSFLRLIDYYKRFPVKTVIYSFIPDDVSRAQLSYRAGAPKPFYQSNEGNIVLNKDHLKPFNLPKEDRIKLKKIFETWGRSFLVMHSINMLSDKTGWFIYFGGSKLEHNDGDKVGCYLMKQLVKFQKENNVTVYILADYAGYYIPETIDTHSVKEDMRKAQLILKCAKNEGLTVIDSHQTLSKIAKNNEETFLQLHVDNNRDRHHSSKGNKVIARLVNEQLSSQ